MTLLERIPRETFHEGSIPVLETKRLALRAPRLGDAKTVAALANDRRIAENTARIPHPYKMSDAESFISRRQQSRRRGGVPDHAARRDRRSAPAALSCRRQTPELGYWLGVPALGQRLRHRGAARGDRLRLHRSRRTRRCKRAPASPTRPRAGCWRSAASSGPASASTASASIKSSAPIDRFRLERGIWSALKSWGRIEEGFLST